MKKNFSKKIAILLFSVSLLVSQISGNMLVVHAADKAENHYGNIHYYEKTEEQPNWLKRLATSYTDWKIENRRVFDSQFAGAVASSINDDGWLKGFLLGGLLSKDVEYYNQPTKVFDKVNNAYKGLEGVSTTEPNCYYSYEGTNDNSTTNNYRIYQDNSNTYQWYNPITQNYNYTDNFYYSFDYNTYYYQQTTNNYQYDYYYVDNSTHVTNYIIETNLETNQENEYVYDMYYKLPDGRSSYNIEKNEVWGKYFIYDAQNYELVAEDDGKTLGLWHFDGNLNDSSYWNNSTGTSNNLEFYDAFFGKGKVSPYDPSYKITLPVSNSSFDNTKPYTLEWIEYNPSYNTGSSDKTAYNHFIMPNYKYFNNVIQYDKYAYYALVFDGTNYSLYVNGIKKSLSTYTSDDYYTANSTTTLCGFSIGKNYIFVLPQELKYQYFTSSPSSCYVTREHYNSVIDEMRLSKGALYTNNYVPSAEPFTTNKVLVIPENVKKNTILFYTGYENSGYRIGGVRPTYPTDGYVYIHLENDVVDSVQQYQTNQWVEIEARVYVNDTTVNLVGYDMSTFTITEPIPPSNSNTSVSGGDSGGSSVSGGDSGGNSGGNSGGSGVSSIVDGMGKLVDSIATILGKVIGMISDLITSLFDSLGIFTTFSEGFSNFLSETFTFIPPEFWTLIGTGILVMIIIGVIKIIKG